MLQKFTDPSYLRPRVHGLIRLTRYRDYAAFVTVLTLLGWFFSRQPLTVEHTFRLLLLLVANLLSVGFTFMINDIEDADDDAMNPAKAKRNPVSAGILSQRVAYIATFAVAVVSYLIFSRFNALSFTFGAATLILGLLYSWRVIRLKSIPVVDLISHSLMLAGLQLMASYFAFVPYSGFTLTWVLPVVLVVAVSMYGELFNELRDYTYDRKAGVWHTAALLGKKNAYRLMYTLLGVAALALLASIWVGLISLWFIALVLGVSVLVLTGPLLRLRKQQGLNVTGDLQQPAIIVVTIALLIWGVAQLFTAYLGG